MLLKERPRLTMYRRAITLAKSGDYLAAGEIKAQLVREGYTDGFGQLFDYRFRWKLERICTWARGAQWDALL